MLSGKPFRAAATRPAGDDPLCLRLEPMEYLRIAPALIRKPVGTQKPLDLGMRKHEVAPLVVLTDANGCSKPRSNSIRNGATALLKRPHAFADERRALSLFPGRPAATWGFSMGRSESGQQSRNPLPVGSLPGLQPDRNQCEPIYCVIFRGGVVTVCVHAFKPARNVTHRQEISYPNTIRGAFRLFHKHGATPDSQWADHCHSTWWPVVHRSR